MVSEVHLYGYKDVCFLLWKRSVPAAVQNVLALLVVVGAGQVVLLEQGVDLVGAPEVVVDLAGLCLADGGELDWFFFV